MSVRRVMGTEVEYGISVPGQPLANPMVASSQVVNAYASATAKARRARWDFEEESPLRDARGFDLSPAQALDHNDLDEDTGMANVILTNGARLYVDHAHPEYSTPEVTNPRDVVPTLRYVDSSARFASPIITCSRRYLSASACGSSRVLMIGRFSVVSRPTSTSK